MHTAIQQVPVLELRVELRMVTWIKLSTTIFDDEKIAIIESMPDCDALLVMWIKLLIQAGKCNSGGYIWLEEGKPYSEEMLSAIFRRPLNTVRLALQTFQQLGMVELDNTGIFIVSWEKHQNTQALEIIREQARLRKQKQRALLPEAVTVMSRSCHGHVTQQDKEEERELEKEQDTKNILTGGTPPIDPFSCCHSFSDYRNLMDGYENQVGFLIGAFRNIHRDAPASDFEDIGGRLGKLWANNNRDTGFILKVMWDISTSAVAGSRLDYLHKALAAKKASKGKIQRDPDKYVRGKYGHMVQR